MESATFFEDFKGELETLSLRLESFLKAMPTRLSGAAYSLRDTIGCGGLPLAWPSIYFLLPFWLACDLGTPDSPPRSEDLCFANACLAYAVLVRDHLSDEADADRTACISVGDAFYTEGLLTYAGYFPSDSTFWRTARHKLWEASEMQMIEVEDSDTPNRLLDLEHYALVQSAKVNVGQLAIGAALTLAGPCDGGPLLEDHLREWQVGCQMLDDLEDLEQDARSGRMTRVMALAGARSVADDPVTRVNQLMGSGGGDGYLGEALECFCRSAESAPSPAGYLASHANYWLRLCRAKQVYYRHTSAVWQRTAKVV